MIHFPSVILQNGPLVGMSCLRYELKNSFFKRVANNMSNRRNVCHTLAKRHQQNALFTVISGTYVRNFITVGKSNVVLASSLKWSDLICEKFGIENTSNIAVANKLCVASIEYSVGTHLIVNIDSSGVPEFGKVEKFACLPSSDDWVCVVRLLRSIEYYSHFHSYCVNYVQPVQYKIAAVSELVDYHPVCCYKKAGKFYVRLQYHVIKPL